MTTATARDRYRQALASIPPPGTGCHTYLLTVANLGIRAGVDPQQLFADIRQNTPAGSRHVPDREILDAIERALADHQGGTFAPRLKPKPLIRDGKAALRRIIDQAKNATEVDLWEASPIRLDSLPDDDPVLLLETLYRPDDLLFIGDQYEHGVLGITIRPVAAWLTYFRAGGQTKPHIIVNPLDGIPRSKKSGEGDTLRGDANVKTFRFCVVEFDTLPRDDQLRFWSAVKLPIAALLDSGGKSIHAWLDVTKLGEITSADAWGTEIEMNLYERLLSPLGVDRACSNASRLSRLPGHYRTERQAYQRLLWLSPEGREIV